MPFGGFPPRVRYTPVPNPFFGPLLEQIDDLAELKCTLRVIWLLNQKRGYPRLVTLGELLADKTLARSLPDDGVPGQDLVELGLARAVDRGSLATGLVTRDGGLERVYVLNSEPQRKALASVAEGDLSPVPGPRPNRSNNADERPNIYAIYEDNIGMLSPIIAEELREAEELYPESWIEDAFREAVAQNKRSWRYIARILERWEREGKDDGEPGRYPGQASHYSSDLRGRSTSARRR